MPRSVRAGPQSRLPRSTRVANVWRGGSQKGRIVASSPPFRFDFVDDINGRTYLHEAAISGHVRLVLVCIQNGIDVNRQDVYGRTALHYAAIHGHAQVCQSLLEHASSVSDLNALTPLVYAVARGRVE